MGKNNISSGYTLNIDGYEKSYNIKVWSSDTPLDDITKEVYDLVKKFENEFKEYIENNSDNGNKNKFISKYLPGLSECGDIWLIVPNGNYYLYVDEFTDFDKPYPHWV